jgi:acyl-CoA hydrolase
VLVRWMGVTDTNQADFVHGGTVMKLCDEAAGLAAVRHTRMRVVTAGVDRMTFLERVELGDLVTFKASVNATTARLASVRRPLACQARTPRRRAARSTRAARQTLALSREGQPDPLMCLLGFS